MTTAIPPAVRQRSLVSLICSPRDTLADAHGVGGGKRGCFCPLGRQLGAAHWRRLAPACALYLGVNQAVAHQAIERTATWAKIMDMTPLIVMLGVVLIAMVVGNRLTT